MQIHIHPGHARQLPPAFLIPACTRGLSGRPCLDWLLMKYLQVYMHSDHILVGRGGVGRGGAGRGRAGQGRAGQGRAGQGRAGQGRSKARQGSAGCGRAIQDRLEQGRVEWSRAGQNTADQGRSGQDRAWQHGLPRPEHVWSNDGLRHNFVLLSIIAMPCDVSQSN